VAGSEAIGVAGGSEGRLHGTNGLVLRKLRTTNIRYEAYFSEKQSYSNCCIHGYPGARPSINDEYVFIFHSLPRVGGRLKSIYESREVVLQKGACSWLETFFIRGMASHLTAAGRCVSGSLMRCNLFLKHICNIRISSRPNSDSTQGSNVAIPTHLNSGTRSPFPSPHHSLGQSSACAHSVSFV
jgi:hypothetical protein